MITPYLTILVGTAPLTGKNVKFSKISELRPKSIFSGK